MTEPRYPPDPAGYPPPPQWLPPEPPDRGPSTAQNVAIGIAVVLALVLAGLVVWYLAFRSEEEPPVQEAPESGGLFVSTTAVDFGDQLLGRESPSQTVRLVNAGGAPVDLLEIEITGDNPAAFELADETDCVPGASIAPQGACSIVLQFAPTARGPRTALLLVRHAGAEEAIEISVEGTGTGEALPSLSAARLEYGEVALGRRAEAQEVEIGNGGTVPLAIEQILIRGEHAGDFPLAQRTTCTGESVVSPGESCVIAVAFRPGALGERTATLVVRHDGGDEPLTVSLRGTGAGEPRSAIQPAEVDLGAVDVGASSAPIDVTLANRGSAPLTIDAIVFTGPQSADFSLADGTTCSTETPLENGSQCTLAVVFSPSGEGPRVATLLVVHDAPRRITELELTGEGIAEPEPEPEPAPPAETTVTTP